VTATTWRCSRLQYSFSGTAGDDKSTRIEGQAGSYALSSNGATPPITSTSRPGGRVLFTRDIANSHHGPQRCRGLRFRAFCGVDKHHHQRTSAGPPNRRVVDSSGHSPGTATAPLTW